MWSNIFDHAQIAKFLRQNFAFDHVQTILTVSFENIDHDQKELKVVKIFSN
jgi:hypothetical protein